MDCDITTVLFLTLLSTFGKVAFSTCACRGILDSEGLIQTYNFVASVLDRRAALLLVKFLDSANSKWHIEHFAEMNKSNYLKTSLTTPKP